MDGNAACASWSGLQKDGTKIDWVVGESEKDPLFVVTDLLPHLDDKKRRR